MNTKKDLIFSLILGLICNPLAVFSQEILAPYEQEFILTAYYSPLPDQCCYVKGNYAADVILNGQGTNGADGTEVYPGMIAAPPIYAFGTRVSLPGLGSLTVHDRGGAIQVLETGAHRLDVWVGAGEEGLARALVFGVKRIKGTVYPKGSMQPEESFAMESLSAPLDILKPFAVERTALLSLQPAYGDKTASALLMQERLTDAGYFSEVATGFFGPVTKQSLESFLADHDLSEPSDRLTQKTAAYLVAASERKNAKMSIRELVDPGSTGSPVLQAQRTLRFLGYYRGRTNGRYDDTLRAAIVAFQKEQKLISDAGSPGAGRIGPLTKVKILSAWKAKQVAKRAEKILALYRIEEVLAARQDGINRFFGEGEQGTQVTVLQKMLAAKGHFPADRVSGLFGPQTRDALIEYQLATDIIKKATDKGAGYVGPATIVMLKREQRDELYSMVRAKGWDAL